MVVDDAFGQVNESVFSGLQEGIAEVVFESENTGCISDPIQIQIVECASTVSACTQVDEGNIICDYADFIRISGTLDPQNGEGDQPMGALCTDGDGADNMTWFGFVALEGDYDILV